MLTVDRVKRFMENHYSDEMLASLKRQVESGGEVYSPATTGTEEEDQIIPHEWLTPMIESEYKRRGLS